MINSKIVQIYLPLGCDLICNYTQIYQILQLIKNDHNSGIQSSIENQAVLFYKNFYFGIMFLAKLIGPPGS